MSFVKVVGNYCDEKPMMHEEEINTTNEDVIVVEVVKNDIWVYVIDSQIYKKWEAVEGEYYNKTLDDICKNKLQGFSSDDYPLVVIE